MCSIHWSNRHVEIHIFYHIICMLSDFDVALLQHGNILKWNEEKKYRKRKQNHSIHLSETMRTKVIELRPREKIYQLGTCHVPN